MRPLKEIIQSHASGRKVLVLLLLTNAVFAFMLTVTIPATSAYAGGMKILDMLPLGYDAQYVHTLFDHLGEEGRHFYLTRQLPADMVYPLLFGIAYCLFYAWLLGKLNLYGTRWWYGCALPLFAADMDYLENFSIILMLKRYPDISPALASASNFFSVAKSVATTVYWTVVLIALLMLAGKLLHRKKAAPGQ